MQRYRRGSAGFWSAWCGVPEVRSGWFRRVRII
jgi:hypothetical protein